MSGTIVEGRKHDCMDAGGRVTPGRIYGCMRYDPRDGEGRTESGKEVESDAGSQSRTHSREHRDNKS